MPVGWMRRLWRRHLRTANRGGIAYVENGEYDRAIQAFTAATRHDANNGGLGQPCPRLPQPGNNLKGQR